MSVLDANGREIRKVTDDQIIQVLVSLRQKTDNLATANAHAGLFMEWMFNSVNERFQRMEQALKEKGIELNLVIDPMTYDSWAQERFKQIQKEQQEYAMAQERRSVKLDE